jgi:hypothetical protein
MKATVEHEFDGCHFGCPYFVGYSMGPEYCDHPSFPKQKKIVGYSSSSCEIPDGKEYPEWCPVAKVPV